MNERKKSYLQYKYKNIEWDDEEFIRKNHIINVFKKAEMYENSIQKDLSEWSLAEITDFYKSLCTPSVDVLYNCNSVYQRYTAWCIYEKMITNMNHYDEITREFLLQCIHKAIAKERIISREELLNTISKLKNPRDSFIVLACFEGISGQEMKELRNINLADFDTERKIVKLGEREIPYTDELYRYAREAAEQTYYNPSEDASRTYRLVGEPGQIVKKALSKEKADTMNTTSSAMVIYRILKDIQKETNSPAFVAKALKESGRIHMIKGLMKEGRNIKEAIKATCERYGKLVSIPSYIDKYNDFLK